VFCDQRRVRQGRVASAIGGVVELPGRYSHEIDRCGLATSLWHD
jgi:hypothetical protein